MAAWRLPSFDIPPTAGPLYLMRCVRVGVVSALFWCFVCAGVAQSPGSGVSAQSQPQSPAPAAVQTNTSVRVLSAPAAETPPAFDSKPIAEDHPELRAGKKWRIGGPLISIFKGGTVRRAPTRFFQWINPFRRSSEESATEMQFNGYQNLSTRPWNTIVGWHPTHSSFSDAITHEGAIQLISISPNP
jgi:hypothetical protein